MWASSDIETNALQLDSFLCMSREILMLISLGCLEFQKLKNNELSRLTTLEKNAVLLHFHFPKIWSPTWEREEEWGERANWICLHKSAKWAAAEQIEWIIARLCLSSSPTTTTTTDDDDSKQSIKFGFLHLEFPTWTMIDRLVISALSCNSENLLTCSVYSLFLSLPPSLPN